MVFYNNRCGTGGTKMRVCVLGLGQVGIPTVMYIASRGFKVWGYDISENAVTRAKNDGVNATINWDEISQVDVYVVCVSTSAKNNMPDLTNVFNACKKIAQSAERSSLVSIESTVVPGTCRKIHEKIFDRKLLLVHVPHRYWAGDPIRHGVKQTRVIGALDKKSMEQGLRFYRDQLEIPLQIAPVVEIAEMSKIAENAYRYVQIAFAEELRMTCEELDLNFEDVRKACNTKWNIEILEARDGINGHCLPKDVKSLESMSLSDTLLKGAMCVDKAYRKWLARKKQSPLRLTRRL
jgi:nucleotide sugar dehydrogenase